MKLVVLALVFLSSGLSGGLQSKRAGQAVCPDTLFFDWQIRKLLLRF